jgi:RND family efflux transporter MFP subunit
VKYKKSLSNLYPALIVGMGVLICFLLIITKPVAEAEEIKRAAPIVDIELITSESMNITIKSQGTVIPRTESQLYPEITGEVVYVSPKLDEGSSFNKGDVLLKIDSRDYELDIKTAEANLDDANSALFVAQAESNFEREQWEQSNSGIASDLRLKIPQLKKAESRVEAAQANLEKLKRNLQKTTISAPYDGLVRKKNVDRGTVIGPGYLIANIYAIDYVEVKLPIPDEDLAFLDIPLDGTQIDIENQSKVTLVGSLGGKNIIWEGNIVRMEAEFDSKSRMAILIARVSNPYKYEIPLRIGQFVEADITGKRYDNIYSIDREIIKNNNEVVVVNTLDSTLDFRAVNILRYIDDIALIDKGLVDEIPICITNLDVMFNGMKIQLK